MEQIPTSNELLKKPPLLFSCRLTYTICAFLAIICHHFLKLNLTFALVCMIAPKEFKDSGKNISEVSSIEKYLGKKIPQDEISCLNLNKTGRFAERFTMGEFSWSKSQQGIILSAFFYGFLVAQPIGGRLSDRFGGKRFLVSGLIGQGLVTMMFPLIARIHLIAAITLRVIEGVFCGLSLPAIYQLYTKWATETERTHLMSLAYTAHPIGSLIIFPFSSFMCRTNIDGGWAMVFYASGGFSFVLGIFFIWIVYDNIDSHPRISEDEYNYLSHINVCVKKRKIPWRRFVTSVPLYVYLSVHFCQVWGYTTMMLSLTQYIKEVLYFDIKFSGYFSSLPYIMAVVSRIMIAFTFRKIHTKSGLSLTNFRKINHIIGISTSIVCLAIITFLTCHESVGIFILFGLLGGLLDLSFLGSYLFSILELAPAFAGFLTGIANSFGNLGGIISPNVTNYLTKNSTKAEWNNVFYIIIVLFFLSGLLYTFFGSSKPLEWGQSKEAEIIDPNPKENRKL